VVVKPIIRLTLRCRATFRA